MKPFKLKFKKGTYDAGRQLYTEWQELKMRRVHWAKVVFSASVIEKTGKDGDSYYGYRVERERMASLQEIAHIAPWMSKPDQLASMAKATDEIDEKLETIDVDVARKHVGRVNNSAAQNRPVRPSDHPSDDIPHPADTESPF